MDYKKYNNTKLIIGITKAIITFSLIFLFLYTGLNSVLYGYITGFTGNSYLQFIFFVFFTGTAMSLLFLPLSYYSGFILEHKFNLSNQTTWKWILENLKGILVSIIIGVPVLLFFFYALNKFGNLWWLPFAAGLFVVSIILAKIVPIFILPLFYKVTPLEESGLIRRIKELAVDSGIKVENVFKFDMSRNTKKANAAFAGIGKSKRILLGDTLLDNYSEDEIETVIAHELGHYKKKHIIKNIFIGTASSFLTLFVIAELYRTSINWFGFSAINYIPALPLISLWGMLIGLIQAPLTNMLSRKYEYEADEYAVSSTGKPEAFKNTLNKLTDQNLGDKDPHPLVEWFFYSHPSIKNRLTAINRIQTVEGAA